MDELNLEDDLAEQLRREEEAMLAAELATLEADPSLAAELAEKRAAEALKRNIEENKRRAAEKRAQYVLDKLECLQPTIHTAHPFLPFLGKRKSKCANIWNKRKLPLKLSKP